MNNDLIMSALSNDMSFNASQSLSNGEMVETSMDTLQNVIANSTVPVNYGYYRKPIQQVRDGVKIGRNDTCPCGSGKKFKHCCINTGKYNQVVDKV